MNRLRGLFLDPRIWQIDFLSSPFWNPEKFNIEIDLHDNAFNIPKVGLKKKYDFIIATEVWEIPMRKTLEWLKSVGVPIFLVPREILPTKAYRGQMFGCEKYKYNNSYYYRPDLLMSPSKFYADLWENKIENITIGSPRFDLYISEQRPSREHIIKKYKLEEKKIIFFPSYPPYYPQTIDRENIMVDLYEDLQNTMGALESYARENKDIFVVVKIHPMAQKCYNKKIGKGNEVSGLLEKYYCFPNKNIMVIGDQRNNGIIAKELLIVSDIVIGFTSIMLLEAINENKPTLHLLFDQASKLKDLPDYSSSIKTVKNAQELIRLLDEMISNPSKFILCKKDIVEKYLYKIDGKFCERFCKATRSFLEK